MYGAFCFYRSRSEDQERQEVDTVKELIGKLDVMSMSW